MAKFFKKLGKNKKLVSLLLLVGLLGFTVWLVLFSGLRLSLAGWAAGKKDRCSSRDTQNKCLNQKPDICEWKARTGTSKLVKCGSKECKNKVPGCNEKINAKGKKVCKGKFQETAQKKKGDCVEDLSKAGLYDKNYCLANDGGLVKNNYCNSQTGQVCEKGEWKKLGKSCCVGKSVKENGNCDANNYCNKGSWGALGKNCCDDGKVVADGDKKPGDKSQICNKGDFTKNPNHCTADGSINCTDRIMVKCAGSVVERKTCSNFCVDGVGCVDCNKPGEITCPAVRMSKVCMNNYRWATKSCVTSETCKVGYGCVPIPTGNLPPE